LKESACRAVEEALRSTGAILKAHAFDALQAATAASKGADEAAVGVADCQAQVRQLLFALNCCSP
jgi:hypothetical protein